MDIPRNTATLEKPMNWRFCLVFTHPKASISGIAPEKRLCSALETAGSSSSMITLTYPMRCFWT